MSIYNSPQSKATPTFINVGVADINHLLKGESGFIIKNWTYANC